MTSEMIERVAMACMEIIIGRDKADECLSYNGDVARIWRTAARAAIAAMREPSIAMLHAADVENEDAYIARGRAYSAWQLMIDCALTESGHTPSG